MAAATVTQNYVNTKRLYSLIKSRVLQQKLPGSDPAGQSFKFEFTSDTIGTSQLDDADDITEFFTFPRNCRLWSLRVIAATALESGTPASEVDFKAGDTVLINNSQVLRANNSTDELDAGLIGVDVSGLTLKMAMVTACDGEVAGTLQFLGEISVSRDNDDEVIRFGAVS